MKIKYIAASIALSLPILVSADNGNLDDFLDAETVSAPVATVQDAKVEQQQDTQAGMLALSLGLKDKGFIFAKSSKARQKKIRKKKQKAGYKTSSRSGAQIDKRMVFASGSAQLSYQAKQRVATLAAVYKQYKKIKRVFITGHTDTVGNDAKNMALSDARAQSVKRELIALGVPAHKVSAVGHGETQLLPKMSGSASANRRVEYKVQL